MKKTLILMAFIVSACGAPVSALAPPATEYRTPQPTATQSPVPTATTGYEATAHAAETSAYIAQSTADAANRVMVQATNDQQQREHEAAMQNADATAQAQADEFTRDGWTATAALTAIPLTSTAQVDNLTAIADYKAVTIAQLTATAALPTQIVAESNARTQAKLAPVFAFVQLFAIFAIGVFMLFAAWFMRWYWMREDARQEKTAHAASPQGVAERNGFTPIAQSEPEPEFIQPTETVITVRQDHGDGNMRMDKYTVPCTREQLLQVAENVLTKGWTLAINQWESAETLFTRNTFGKLRSWLQSNQFAVSAGSGTLALSPEGQAFLDAFLNAAQLPTEYQFGEAAQ